MLITRNIIETTPGPSEWFTGAVYIDSVATPSEPSRLSASSVHFTPGARTAWHTHPNGQTIYVTEGVGLAQRRGGPIEVIRPGDRVFFEPGEDHWHGDAPGSMEAYKGHELVGKLQGGRISGSRVDPFESEWLPGQFSRLLEDFVERHEAARNRARELSGERWAPLEPTLPRRITERMMKRVVSVLRDARHGGTVVFVPTGNAGEHSSEDPYIDLRYPFADGPARRSFP